MVQLFYSIDCKEFAGECLECAILPAIGNVAALFREEILRLNILKTIFLFKDDKTKWNKYKKKFVQVPEYSHMKLNFKLFNVISSFLIT